MMNPETIVLVGAVLYVLGMLGLGGWLFPKGEPCK